MLSATEHDLLTPTAMDRRAFLGGAVGVLPLVATSPGLLRAQAPGRQDPAGADRAFPGVITRQHNPDNLEFPFPALRDFLTPNEQFYVRTHFEVPALDGRTWRLRIEGAVEHPLEIGYDELRRLPARTVRSLLECSGNGRVFLQPPQLGIRWEQGGVSNAEWTGVPLSTILDRAGVRDGAVEVLLEGADQGRFREPNPKTPGVIHYARSLPLRKARQAEVLLAYRMNGHDLPASHGYPVRAVVPGWYGMASVKWLERIRVTDHPFHGFFQTLMYTVWQRRDGEPELVPVTEIDVKAQIARPVAHEIVPAGMPYRVFGAAWAGEADVTRVELSVDGGQHWQVARLIGEPVRFAWRFWEHRWMVPQQPGRYTLMARATDSRRRVQPLERDEDRRDAMISHVQRIGVTVR